MKLRLSVLACASLGLILGSSGCGGGGGGDASGQTVVTGSVVKGPVAGATVTLYSVNPDGTRGALLGTGTTNANAQYSIPIPRHSGPILVEAINGTYDDEAVPGPDVTPLTAVLRGAANLDASMTAASINATPLTETAVRRALAGSGGITVASLASSEKSVVADAGLPAGTDIVRTVPVVTAGTTDPYGLAVLNFARVALTAGGVTKALDVYAKAIPAGRAPVNLGAAGAFTILSKTGITNVATSKIIGDVGTSPISGTALLLTCTEVTGNVVVVDTSGPQPCAVAGASTLTSAVGAMETAYTDAAGRTSPDFTELGAGEIGGMTLAPGLYKWGTSLSIGNDVTLSGGADAVWIFQVAGTLNEASGKQVKLVGGAQAKNVFWQVGDSVTIQTSAHFEGVLLGKKLIALKTSASANSRFLAQTAVTLEMNAITQPAN